MAHRLGRTRHPKLAGLDHEQLVTSASLQRASVPLGPDFPFDLLRQLDAYIQAYPQESVYLFMVAIRAVKLKTKKCPGAILMELVKPGDVYLNGLVEYRLKRYYRVGCKGFLVHRLQLNKADAAREKALAVKLRLASQAAKQVQ